MEKIRLQRRQFLTQSAVAITAATALTNNLLSQALAAGAKQEIIPWSDQPPAEPAAAAGLVQNLHHWEDLDSWLTPTGNFFNVAHYNRPLIAAEDWSLEITGLVKRPIKYRLADLQARPRRDLLFTLECSGNNGFPWFPTGIGTARWTGTSLASLLHEAQILDRGIEVVFFGTDAGVEEVRGIKMPQNFARSMRLADAMQPDNLLCYEMNGAPLAREHGFPLRLIAPGWYGIANVKWLKRIEVWDTRLENRFMGRDYVTIREAERDGQPIWLESSVGRSRLKSTPAAVVRNGGRYQILGMAWGAPIGAVEVRIDEGPWQKTAIDAIHDAKYAWRLWSFDWSGATPGPHAITSRAIGRDGTIQPAMQDPSIAGKHTYWESNGQITRHIRLPVS